MKLLTRIVQVLGVLTIIFMMAFYWYLNNNRPHHPVGNFTVEVINHGQHFFITRTENLVESMTWPFFFVLVVLGMGLEAANRAKK